MLFNRRKHFLFLSIAILFIASLSSAVDLYSSLKT